MALHHRIVIFAIFTVHITFIFLFFDTKVHIGGDDSDYLIASLDFIAGEAFPSWHGSFYPIFISPLIYVFGLNILLLKVISVAITIATFFVFYKTFYGRMPNEALYFALAISCFSHAVVCYAGTTYSEPLFMLLQSLVFYFFVRLEESESKKLRIKYILFTTLCLCTFLLSITRNVGMGAAIAFAIYFLHQKRWRDAIFFTCTFFLFHGAFSLYKILTWSTTQLGTEGQFSRIAYKNFYNAADGKEDLLGFVVRFWENSQLYLSKHLSALIGIKSSTSLHTSAKLTVMFYLIYVLTLVLSYRKNRLIFFTILYIGLLSGVTFVTQQIQWDQVRLILVYLPLIALTFGYTVHSMITKKPVLVRYVAKTVLILLPSLVFLRTAFTKNNLINTVSNLTNDPFQGYPDAWKNYVLVSKWAGAHISSDKNILCRKPGISRVYGERKFLGISRFTDTIPERADQFLQTREIDYVILDHLSMPTVTRLLSYYLKKDPLGLKLIYKEGKNDLSALLEVKRTPPNDDVEYLSRVRAGLFVFPEHPYFYLLAANRYLNKGNFNHAVTYYSHALQLSKDKREKSLICKNRGYALACLGEHQKAKTDLLQALTYVPDDPQALDLLDAIVEKNKQLNTSPHD